MPVEMITSGAITVIAPSFKSRISDKNADHCNTHYKISLFNSNTYNKVPSRYCKCGHYTEQSRL